MALAEMVPSVPSLPRVASALERDLGRATVSLNFENSSLDGITYLSSHTRNWFFCILN